MLDYLAANTNGWKGAMWWAAGPRWGSSASGNMEPPNGVAYTGMLSTLKPCM